MGQGCTLIIRVVGLGLGLGQGTHARVRQSRAAATARPPHQTGRPVRSPRAVKVHPQDVRQLLSFFQSGHVHGKCVSTPPGPCARQDRTSDEHGAGQPAQAPPARPVHETLPNEPEHHSPVTGREKSIQHGLKRAR